jgi:predicted metallopeptidase
VCSIERGRLNHIPESFVSAAKKAHKESAQNRQMEALYREKLKKNQAI